MGKCPYRLADSVRDRRLTADYRMGIHPQPANVDLAVYGDLAVGRVLILNNPPAWRSLLHPFSSFSFHSTHHGFGVLQRVRGQLQALRQDDGRADRLHRLHAPDHDPPAEPAARQEQLAGSGTFPAARSYRNAQRPPRPRR